MRIDCRGMAIALAALTLARGALAAPVEIVLYGFKGGSDGVNPLAGLIADKQGALYGTTEIGGSGNEGTVFKLTPPAEGQTAWTETVLYRFCSQLACSDGSLPSAGSLIADKQGALYGTTAGGGSSNNGTVFNLTPPAEGQTAWTETVLHRFTGSDGADPVAGLIANNEGAFYSATASGGTCSAGTVFELTPPAKGQTVWTETVLYSFAGGSDGATPVAGLIADNSGALYGTTRFGGSSGNGTVFKLTPPAKGQTVWTETVLYRFAGGNDGRLPYASLIADNSGALYGTTQRGGSGCPQDYGCGTVFMLTPPAKGQTVWTETVLYRFTGGSDGASPLAGLIADKQGALYGTTAVGGGQSGCPQSAFFGGCGTVFKLTPPAKGQTTWTETVLYSFKAGTDGAIPYAGLIADKEGTVYSTTGIGGNSGNNGYGFGTVFKLALCPEPMSKDCPVFISEE
jgi:uncharacterized repeat protein (TIGR03803 family)